MPSEHAPGGQRAAFSLAHPAPCCSNLPADLIRRMLEYRASERITAAEALRHPFFALQF